MLSCPSTHCWCPLCAVIIVLVGNQSGWLLDSSLIIEWPPQAKLNNLRHGLKAQQWEFNKSAGSTSCHFFCRVSNYPILTFRNRGTNSYVDTFISGSTVDTFQRFYPNMFYALMFVIVSDAFLLLSKPTEQQNSSYMSSIPNGFLISVGKFNNFEVPCLIFSTIIKDSCIDLL